MRGKKKKFNAFVSAVLRTPKNIIPRDTRYGIVSKFGCPPVHGTVTNIKQNAILDFSLAVFAGSGRGFARNTTAGIVTRVRLKRNLLEHPTLNVLMGTHYEVLRVNNDKKMLKC